MMSDGQPPHPERDPAARLRARGLRVTPQRRAILGAFTGASTEHLSADEVHARASATVPEVSRGTVYAALAELTELGLLAAVGSPEPVRYETNATDHQHFRCRICLRLYDVELPAVRTDRLKHAGFQVERSTVTVEGVCADCVNYGSGLEAGTTLSVSPVDTPIDLPSALACTTIDTPIGTVLLAATPAGLVRAIYDDHFEAATLRGLAARRRGGQAARGHLADATAFIDAYFADQPSPATCVVDWDALRTISVPTLQAVQAIRPGLDRSYETLGGTANPRDRGLALGTNPLAIVVPCHRVTRGREVTEAYIGGPDRKRWLRRHEQR
jgi:Fe2+ or Zn2+ uptake regulation protein/O6-methylguanine-DNA--protein-cysteine methyltransferase